MQHFNKLFESLSPQEKSDYLLKILNKKAKLKNAFMEEFKNRLEKIRLKGYLPENIEELLQEVNNKAEELKDDLDTLDFTEIDWERAHSHNHYVPEWEVAQEITEEEAMEIFQPYLLELEIAIKAGNLIDIAKQYLIIFHGAMQSEIKDPDNNFSDSPEDFFIYQAKSLIDSKIKELSKKEFLSGDYQNTFDLIFRFNKIYYAEKTELLEGLSSLLIPIIKNKEIANFAWQKKEEYSIDLSSLPKLLNQIVSSIGDNKLWLKNMEECFLSDEETSLKLMDYYFENDKEKFEIDAQLLFASFKSTGKYLIEKVKLGTKLYIDLLKYLSKQNSSVEYFEKLKKYLDANEIIEYVNTVERADFKAGLLAHEKRYEELIQFIDKECIKGTSFFGALDFKEGIKLLIDYRPDEAWVLINKKIEKMMNQAKGRENYANIAKTLNIAKLIKGKYTEVEILIKELYNHRPNLPALKDEFKKEGLI